MAQCLGEKTSAIGYEVDTQAPARPTVRLIYTLTHPTGEKEDIDEPVRLQTTCPHWGGVRWWFTCPLVVDGTSCRRRVRKLYLPPGGRYFGCRHCHDLTYRSAQEHDQRVDFYCQHPEALWEILDSFDPARVAAKPGQGELREFLKACQVLNRLEAEPGQRQAFMWALRALIGLGE